MNSSKIPLVKLRFSPMHAKEPALKLKGLLFFLGYFQSVLESK